MEFEDESRGYDGESRAYERDRSRSPRPDAHDRDSRARSASPNGRGALDTRGPPAVSRPQEDEEDAINSGTNLFVTGIHPRLTENDITDLFGKYGQVEKCNIMRDPHTRDSRGFGFVNMMTPDQADAAKEGLQGEVYEGRTISIEKARRSRPRTPTPGQYYGPPKRDDFRGPPRGRYRDRYDDRRGYRGYDDHGGSRSSRNREAYDDRSYGRREGYGSRHIDRYASSSRDYGHESRRGGGYYDRESRGGGYSGKDYGSGGRSFDTRGPDPRAEPRAEPRADPRDDRYSRR
ncbi:RNA-binding domain-containing protein [Viridothelium virens]|uniref:RNA-binding domain-containing protein n=1 Tax=Viridothelium virens TaxID=1048519 RepID=A0A6A6H4H9_VIRVR|nr:RNA-binding domain-containing protein [Viridothelium virens]